MSDEWNPNDPDATRVLYDLSSWTFDQQAELASELAEAAIPHTWDGTELVVPESHEAVADSAITRVETRLGVVYDGDPDADDTDGETDGDLVTRAAPLTATTASTARRPPP